MKEEKKVLRSFSEAGLKKIITYKPNGFLRTRLHTILLILIDTGCRIDEILTLRRENADFKNLLINVMGKGSKERIIPISFELRKVLYKYLLNSFTQNLKSSPEGELSTSCGKILEMNKETKKEWTALCQNCRWSGKRRSDRAEAKQDVENHLKTHPQHKVRVLVTGE